MKLALSSTGPYVGITFLVLILLTILIVYLIGPSKKEKE